MPPAASGSTARQLATHALSRLNLRRGARRGAQFLPLPAASLRTGLRAGIRGWLASGAVVIDDRSFPPRGSRLADIVHDSGADPCVDSLRLGSGGSALFTGSLRGSPVVLRVFPSRLASRHAQALETLRHLEVSAVGVSPRLVAHGAMDDSSWLVETRLPGARPRRLERVLAEQVVDFCIGLPPSPHPPAVLAGRLSQRLDSSIAEQLGALERAAVAAWRECPPTGAHGDLWLGNVLADRGALTGVVDWDAYRTVAVPGTDLMHLVATAERLRHRRSMGAELLTRPWSREPLRTFGRRYFERLGLAVDEDRWTAAGVAWWLSQLCDSLDRSPRLATDDRWLHENVTGVLGRV